MENVLELTDVTKSYVLKNQKIPILKGLNLSVGSKEFVAVMGPSGSGKSTLLHIMGGLDHPTSGQVIINGKDVGQYSDAALAKLRNRHIGFVFQSFYLLPYYTALENVCLPLIYADLLEEKFKYAKALLGDVGLSSRMHHKPTELSGGEKQRVAIARALVNQPSILFADEPTGNLDKKTGESILEIIKDVHRRGTAVVLITHDPHVAEQAERTLYIEDGQLV